MKKKLNLLDYLVIIVVILAIAFVGYKKFVVNESRGVGVGVTDSYKTIEYVAEVKGLREVSVNGFHIGDKVYERNKGTYMGTIKNIEVFPYKSDEIDARGNVVYAEKMGHYTVRLTIEGETVDKPNGYFISGNLEFKVNSNYSVITKYIETTLTAIDYIIK